MFCLKAPPTGASTSRVLLRFFNASSFPPAAAISRKVAPVAAMPAAAAEDYSSRWEQQFWGKEGGLKPGEASDVLHDRQIDLAARVGASARATGWQRRLHRRAQDDVSRLAAYHLKLCLQRTVRLNNCAAGPLPHAFFHCCACRWKDTFVGDTGSAPVLFTNIPTGFRCPKGFLHPH